MYDREYEGRELQFEVSGGLLHSSLVMLDAQTNSYWALLKGESIAGDFKGTRLRELPVSQKMMWGDWRALHPDTLVLSVEGVENVKENYYADYFTSKKGFRGATATDDRLSTKTPVFTFRLGSEAYAVAFRALRGGASFQVGDSVVFLYRPKKAKIFYSTVAFVLSESRYRKGEKGWYEEATGAVFDPGSGDFQGEATGRRLVGFDTFWYNWSLNNPETRVLKKPLK